MRRGLMGWNDEELPVAALEARLGKLRAAIGKAGAPVFATALSKRVSEWIRTTDPLSEIVNTPKPGALMGERLAKDAAVKKVGILEYDTLPSGLADEMTAAAPAVEWTDGTAVFSGLRREADDAERGL